MKQQTDIAKILQRLKPQLESEFRVARIGYFGSYSRNEQTDESDVDVLVSFSDTPGWQFFDLQDFLEAELGCKVDLVSLNALREQLKDSILKEVKFI